MTLDMTKPIFPQWEWTPIPPSKIGGDSDLEEEELTKLSDWLFARRIEQQSMTSRFQIGSAG